MDNQQAKLILASFRAGSDDVSDPHFADALAHAAQDAELAAWFAEEQAADEILQRKLQEVEVPEGLRAEILQKSKVVPLAGHGSAWKLLAWAASVAFLVGLGAIWWNSSREPAALTLVDYEVRMVDKLYRPISFDFTSSDAGVIQSWLQTNSALGAVTIPAKVAGLPGIGCETLMIEGRPVAVICFRLASAEVVHLFVMPAAGVADVSHVAVSKKLGTFRTLSWREGNHIYVLAGRHEEQTLRRLREG